MSEAEAVPAPVAEEVAAETAAPLKPCCACPETKQPRDLW